MPRMIVRATPDTRIPSPKEETLSQERVYLTSGGWPFASDADSAVRDQVFENAKQLVQRAASCVEHVWGILKGDTSRARQR